MEKTLTRLLQAKKVAGSSIFIPYIMAGDHDKGVDGLAETITFLADLGVSAIEIGIPFSDPVADGPVIELAGNRSLKNGTTPHTIVKALKDIETKTPLIIMTYFNPIFQYGLEQFIADLADTPVKGLIIQTCHTSKLILSNHCLKKQTLLSCHWSVSPQGLSAKRCW